MTKNETPIAFHATSDGWSGDAAATKPEVCEIMEKALRQILSPVCITCGQAQEIAHDALTLAAQVAGVSAFPEHAPPHIRPKLR